jgi:hypothetical protein
LKIAIDLQGQGDVNIHISIIRSNNYLSGEALASLFRHGNEALFRTEFLFLWEIRATEILHVVSLRALERSNLLSKFKVLDPQYWGRDTLPSLWEIRQEIRDNNEQAWDANRRTWPERSGRYVAAIAKCFGNGAPQRAIASLIWHCGTHFKPGDYELGGLDLRVRDAIRRVLDHEGHSCRHDQWCGELASA